ncbi:MAG: LapA family protein, partial [Ruminococcus sp.]|nr:LapA family protein [Candidatus Apopatosoma intestinale]
MANKKEHSLSRLIRGLTTDVPSGGVRYKTVRSEEKKPFPVSFVIVALLITAMLMLIVFSFVQITRVRSEINRVQEQISEMEKEIGERQRDIDEKYRDVDFEERASELGMTGGKTARVLPRASEKE